MEDVYFTADRLNNWKQVQEFVIHVEADNDESDVQMKGTVISVIMNLKMTIMRYKEVKVGKQSTA